MSRKKDIVGTIEQLIEILENKQKDHFVFRGVTDEAYDLIPGVYRFESGNFLKEHINSADFQHEIFLDFLNNSKNSDYHLYEIYMSGQHYGFKTKLLDFSESYKVALAFAVYGWNAKDENIDKNSRIYFADIKKIKSDEQNIESYNKLFSSTESRKCCFLKPTNHQTKSDVRNRIKKQRGGFVYMPCYENIEDLNQYCDSIIIDKKLIKVIREKLKDESFGDVKVSISSLEDLK